MVDSRINLGLLWLLVPPCMGALVFVLRNLSFIFGLAVFALLPVLHVVFRKILGLFRIGNLEKRAVFITGCDTGFGNLLALKCARRGMPVFAGCLTEKGAQSLKSAAAGLRGTLETIIIDVASDESVATAANKLDEATVQYGGLHAIVNNAGVFGCSFYDDFLSIEQYKEVAEVNTFGVIRVTQALKHLVKKTRGRIVTVTSAAARIGVTFHGPYCVSKWAAAGYCEVLRQELRNFGVSVHILEPGLFKTPICEQTNVKSRLDVMWQRAPLAAKQEYGEPFFHQVHDNITEGVAHFASSHIDHVVDAYFHALTSRFPQLRYNIGFDSMFVLFLSYLPTGMRDAIFTVGDILFMPVPQCVQRKLEASDIRANAIISNE